MDGTVHYGQLASTSEGPLNLQQALDDKNSKSAMDLEVEARHKNKNLTSCTTTEREKCDRLQMGVQN